MLTLRETKSPCGFKLWVPFLQPQPGDSHHSGYWSCENQGTRSALLEDPGKTGESETGTNTLLFLFGKAVV